MVSAVHPHIRGAYVCVPIQNVEKLGSSPHTWGILLASSFCVPPLTVHPHIRGAYAQRAAANKWVYGSSPHTWGIPAHPISRNQLLRFIPTYVGHTSGNGQTSGIMTVHPHIRGAYLIGVIDLSVNGGSSPHTWGIRRSQSRG